jgi:hypothetical protein
VVRESVAAGRTGKGSRKLRFVNKSQHCMAAAQATPMPRPCPPSLRPQPAGARLRTENQCLQRLLRTHAIQAKLSVNQPGDVFEQKADHVADAVMRMPEPGRAVGGPGIRRSPGLTVQRMCPECGAERDREAARHSNSDDDRRGSVAAEVLGVFGRSDLRASTALSNTETRVAGEVARTVVRSMQGGFDGL